MSEQQRLVQAENILTRLIQGSPERAHDDAVTYFLEWPDADTDAGNVGNQVPEYLDGFREAMADFFSRALYEEEPWKDPIQWAAALTDYLEVAGWRMVTAKDWKKMTAAWVLQASR